MDFFVAAYGEIGLSTLSLSEKGSFVFPPYTDDEDAYKVSPLIMGTRGFDRGDML